LAEWADTTKGLVSVQIAVKASLDYIVEAPTSFVFNVAAAWTDHQRVVQESLVIEPDGARTEESKTGRGDNRLLRVDAPAGNFRLVYEALVEMSPMIDAHENLVQNAYGRLPDDTLTFLNPSRYCPSDRFARWGLREFGGAGIGAGLVAAICDWTHARLDYLPGTTDSRTDAAEALIQCAGVCRDYAHVGITFCRAMGIPARYVSGYAVDLDPPDFHGFFEVYLGDAWYLYDATKLAPRESFVRIGVGRDAADCAFATIVGAAQLASMEVSAERRDRSAADREDKAISTA
jgi:transglutaminase-like putative cysteine protease